MELKNKKGNIMNLNIELSQSAVSQLSVLKGKFLMRDNVLYKITDYKIEEVITTPKKSWYNKNPKPETKKILKNVRILGYNSEGRFLGTFDENGCRRLLNFFELYYLRNNWITLLEGLHAFGFEITEILADDPVDNPDLEKAAKLYLKKFFKKNGYENEQDIIKYAVSFHQSLKKD